MTSVPYTEPRLEGKVALVTGGGTGIGRSIAETFLRAGARVVISGRREEPLLRAVENLGGEDMIRAVPGDVTIGTDRGRMLDACVKDFGGLDVLVNNAGQVAATGELSGVTEEAWSSLLAVDLIAPVLLAREALPLLRKRGGAILNVSTGAALRPVSGFGAYGAAKAALNHASLVLALEAAPSVRVNVVCPGGVDTPIYRTFLEDEETIDEMKRRFAEMTPMGRIGQPTDVASAALWLCSDAARWVTGAILTVDGGLNLG